MRAATIWTRLAVTLLASLATLSCAAEPAAGMHYTNPLRDPATGRALACPDPGVTDAGGRGWRYYMVCTSDMDRDGIPIRRSRDLVHWQLIGHVFPARHLPWWALPPTGRQSGGRFWAPELFWIGGRWVVYFATQLNPRRLKLTVPGEGALGTQMVVGVAWSHRLSGPWHTKVLHYRGQFDSSGYAQEWTKGQTGGAIDPSVVRDPTTGGLYLYWAIQPTEIWVGQLSPDGTSLEPGIQMALAATPGWDCDPASICIVEAPEPFYREGQLYLLYSGGSTWDASYAISVATASSPMRVPYNPIGAPLMQSGNGFIGPGHSSQPVIAPDGEQYLLYHAQRNPSRVSLHRVLMLDRMSWVGDSPVIGNGLPGSGG